MGGLKKNSEHYILVKNQLLDNQFDLRERIPHKQILDHNVISGNWAEGLYELPAFSSSVRSLVNDLRAGGHLPSQGEAEGTQGKSIVSEIRVCNAIRSRG
jgi:hypothetical protein